MKTIKTGKISDIGIVMSENQNIMHTSVCIEEERIGRTLYHTYSKYGSHSHSWNDKYHVFDYQLYQWGVDILFHNSDEAIIREFKLYI